MKGRTHVALLLALGLVAASQSGNLVRLADAHPVAIAAYRLGIAAVLMAPLARSRLMALAALPRRDLVLLVLAGVALAAHFFAWIASVQHTTIANAAIFFSVNPVLTASAARILYREPITPRLVLSILLGLSGVVVMGWSDLDADPAHLVGDGLAVLCSALFTAYFLLGKRLRATLDNRVYVTALYAVAAATGFAAMGFLGLPALGYTARTWVSFVSLALVPTMMGHTFLNYALRYVPAGRISALTLSEPAMAGLVAYFAWGEPLTPEALAGYGLICASVLVLLSEGAGRDGSSGDGKGAPRIPRTCEQAHGHAPGSSGTR